MSNKNIDRTERGWRVSDSQGREKTFDRWRDAEEERVWGDEDSDESGERSR